MVACRKSVVYRASAASSSAAPRIPCAGLGVNLARIVTVTLATGSPEEVVRSVNLNYFNPADVDIAAYQADPDTFVEPHAGEVLYRLGSSQAGNLVGESDGREPDPAGLQG
jgi:hypothetical protein